MKNKIIATLLIAPLLMGAGKATPLNSGDKAPFEGLLVDKDGLAKIIANTRLLDEELRLDLQHEFDSMLLEKQLEIDGLKVDLKYQKLESEIFDKADEIRLDFYKTELEKRSDPYREFWFAGGVVVGVGLMLLASYAYKNIDN